MKITILDHKDNIVAILVLGVENGKIYGLASKMIDAATARVLKNVLKNKTLEESVKLLKEEFPHIYKTAFRTFNADTPVVQEHELT